MPRVKLSSTARYWSIVPLWLLLAYGVVALWMGTPVRPWLAVLFAAAALFSIAIGNPWFTYEDGKPSLATTLVRVNSGVGLAGLGILATALFADFVGNGTPPPPVAITDPVAQAAELMRYAATLDFDTTHHAMDQDFLEVKTGAQFDSIIGPLARVFPERSSHLNSPGALVEGRIVAKFEVEADTRRGGIGYPKLRLPVGVSYLWIDNFNSDSSTFRAFNVSANGADSIPNAISLRFDHAVNRAYAWFPWDPADPCICESCMFHGWCRVCGG